MCKTIIFLVLYYGMKKRLLSGVKSTGRLHIGNYFGALRQFVEYQNEYDSFIMIADYHALNFIQNKKEMQESIINIVADYLAVGLDPKKVTIFKQSDISEHTELTWVFDTLITMPYLMRAHAYKDAESKNKEISVGTFNYPVLMASDILLYDSDIVPVGQDQKQHVEYTRDIAQKFNNIYGETFKLPEAKIIKDVAVVPGIDGKKMSKSYKNIIPLFGTDEEIKKAVMSIITDSKGANDSKDPDNCIIFNLHKLFLSEEKLQILRKKYINGEISYKESKELLLEEILKLIRPMRDRREKYLQNKKKILKILKAGGEKAKKEARKKMEEVKNKLGVNVYS